MDVNVNEKVYQWSTIIIAFTVKLDNLRISRYLVIMMTSFIIDLHSRCA